MFRAQFREFPASSQLEQQQQSCKAPMQIKGTYTYNYELAMAVLLIDFTYLERMGGEGDVSCQFPEQPGLIICL
jgi:hypothetical protein